MIVIPRNLLLTGVECGFQSTERLSFVIQDQGDAYVLSTLISHSLLQNLPSAAGLLVATEDVSHLPLEITDQAEVVILVNVHASKHDMTPFTGWLRKVDTFVQVAVSLVDVDLDLFSRIRGLFDTEQLANKRALVIGVGSGGSTIAMELVKTGIGSIVLVDHDRLEVGNVSRHVCGLRDLGRYKTKALRDQLRAKNPALLVETFEYKVDWTTIGSLHALADSSDIVLCCTDNRASRIITNLVCLYAKRPCIYGGAFARASGGMIVRVRPEETMCYQCFIQDFPDDADDLEIASSEAASALGYWDHVLPPEPGLALDIAPIAVMCAKLAVLELLRGTEHTFANLYDDLSAPLFKWLNRREKGSQYEDLPALDSPGCEFRILAWYGISAGKNLACAACSEFVRNEGKTGIFGYSMIERFTKPDIARTEQPSVFPPIHEEL